MGSTNPIAGSAVAAGGGAHAAPAAYGAARRRAGFRHRPWVPFVLALADVAILCLCLWLGWHVRDLAVAFMPLGPAPGLHPGILAGILMLPAACLLMGLYPGYGMSDVERLRRQAGAAAIVFGGLLLWDYIAQDGTWSRGIVLSAWALATVLLPVSFAWLRRALVAAGAWGMPVAVLGARAAGERLVRALMRERALGLVPVAVMDYDPALAGGAVAGVPVVGTPAEAPALARDIRTCAVAMPELSGGQLAELSRILPFPRVVLLPELGGLQSAWVEARDIGGQLGLEVRKNLLLRRNRVLKRALDLAAGVPLLLLFLPLLGLLCAAVVAVSPASPFYRQAREGQGGRPFGMLKLRTMYPDADARLQEHLAASPARRAEWLRRFKLEEDPRVLPWIGGFLRRSSLDELPQLLNVLRGEMSLVGPRPFPDYHLDAFDAGFRALRRGVRPGLTGLWQVEARSDGDLAVQERLDTLYIRNWSLWLDLHILFRTVAAVIGGRGAR